MLTSNFNGILKIWAFDESNHINKEYENVGLLEAQGDKILELISNPYDIGVILAITRSYAIVCEEIFCHFFKKFAKKLTLVIHLDIYNTSRKDG